MRELFRSGLSLTVMAAALLVLAGRVEAGGGNFPPDLTGKDLVATPITAVIVLDPNGPVPFNFSGGANPGGLGPAPMTPTGSIASIAITRPPQGTTRAASVSTTFQVLGGGTIGDLRHGCDLALTDARFVNPSAPVMGGPGTNTADLQPGWVPNYVTRALFDQLGMTLTNGIQVFAVPAITSVISQSCVPFPRRGETLENHAFGDILEHAKIRPNPPAYPSDLTAAIPGAAGQWGAPDPNWKPGFLLMEVTIGLWCPTPPNPDPTGSCFGYRP